MSNQALKWLLIVSVIVNMNFVVVMIMNRRNAEHMVDAVMIENAEQSFRMQSDLLNDLNTNNIDSAKAKLKCGVALQGSKSYVARTNNRERHGRL